MGTGSTGIFANKRSGSGTSLMSWHPVGPVLVGLSLLDLLSIIFQFSLGNLLL